MSQLVKERFNNYCFKMGKYANCSLQSVAGDERGRKYLQTIIDNKMEEVELFQYAIDSNTSKPINIKPKINNKKLKVDSEEEDD